MLRNHYWELADRKTAERYWAIHPWNLRLALWDLPPENLVKAAEATAPDLSIIWGVSPRLMESGSPPALHLEGELLLPVYLGGLEGVSRPMRLLGHQLSGF